MLWYHRLRAPQNTPKDEVGDSRGEVQKEPHVLFFFAGIFILMTLYLSIDQQASNYDLALSCGFTAVPIVQLIREKFSPLQKTGAAQGTMVAERVEPASGNPLPTSVMRARGNRRRANTRTKTLLKWFTT